MTATFYYEAKIRKPPGRQYGVNGKWDLKNITFLVMGGNKE